MTLNEKKPRILIVDDAPENIDILVSLLEQDYQVAATRYGAQALRMARKIKPDLILLDVVMPDVSGYTVCKHLKSEEETSGIPVIFVSALSSPLDETRAFRLGAVDYITKPFNARVVKARVNTHVELKRKTDILEQLVAQDPLTRVANRKKLDEVLEKEWSQSLAIEKPLSLIMLDVDHFKEYNDNYGHTAGDKCLTAVASGISDALTRPGDFVARYGGDEFVVVLFDSDAQNTVSVIRRILRNVEYLCLEHMHSTVAEQVTLSIGAATLVHQDAVDKNVETDLDSSVLMKAADEMLYKVKKEGRNGFCRCVVPVLRESIKQQIASGSA
ncbi:diguanylate cyclase [Oceanospirillum sediminis]|uniref:diguanylate cyclase n=1 Tax=Oceanospirillum sediminis TaxID=2760088 RepID=A0A839IPF4_9GAMM|nr:diguanylate cyclase [Oceanospirillum sediminis]MBB1486369.1 diguanylate cyclase [Oceanospirillum sediminis]